MASKAARLIGRAELMQDAMDTLHDVRQNARNHALLLVGENGSGRSFFMGEAIKAAQEQGWTISKGKCEESAKSNPYQPFFSALGLRFDERGQIVRDYRVASLVDQFMLDSVTTALSLLPIIPGAQVITLGVKIGKAIYQKYNTASTEEEKANKNFEFVRRVIGQIIEKEKKPLLLALDDVQYTSVTTHQLFKHLMDSLPAGQFVLMGTWQLSPEQPFARLSQFVPVKLLNMVHVIGFRPLTRQETEELVRHVAEPGQEITSAICDRIYEFSRGLPELVVESLQLVNSDAPDIFDEKDIKKGIVLDAQAQALTARHLKDIPAEGMILLEAAANMGRQFRLEPFASADLLKYLGLTERQTFNLFAKMLASGSVLNRTEDGRLKFTSEYLWVYVQGDPNSPLATRDSYYLAQALEKHVPNLDPAELAQAFLAGGDFAKASEYAARSARILRAHGALPEAMQAYRQAVTALYRAPQGPETRQKHINLFQEASDVAEQAGDYAEALQLLEQAVSLATGVPAEIAETAARQGWLYHLMGDDTKALSSVQHCMKMCLAAGDEVRAARCNFYLGSIYLAMRDWGTALACFEAYIAASKRVDLNDDLDLVYMEVGYIYRHQGRFDEAEAVLNQGIAISECQDDALGLARGYHYLGLNYGAQGKPEAFTMLEKSLELARGKAASPQREAMVLNSLADLYLAYGRMEEAMQALEQSRQIVERLRDTTNLAANMGETAQLYHQRWEHSAAVERYEQVLNMLRNDTDADLHAPWIHHYLLEKGDVYLLSAELTEAEACYQQAKEYISRIADETARQEASVKTLLAEARLDVHRNDLVGARQIIEKFDKAVRSGKLRASVSALRSEIAQLEGDIVAAEENLQNARSTWEQGGRAYDRMLVYCDLARLRCNQGDMVAASEWANKAADLARLLGNKHVLEWIKQFQNQDQASANEPFVMMRVGASNRVSSQVASHAAATE